ncbi:hypothetical protein B0H66DRAFT_113713 [Apodospora peruviana]|uniref:Secreted protein n=1 Tax=Apodospora peruviana TaxID=516989 RepID=A0AAE0IHC2_9PEZI|nr:hypothetical protein B0H66DRAFT_113713 [Apodospora peruviana]
MTLALRLLVSLWVVDMALRSLVACKRWGFTFCICELIQILNLREVKMRLEMEGYNQHDLILVFPGRRTAVKPYPTMEVSLLLLI